MTADVRSFVKECVECQKGNVGKHDRVPMEMMPAVQTPFEILAADIVGPLPITVRRNRYYTHYDGFIYKISRGYTTQTSYLNSCN